jgi:signal transduction histidine kinase
VNVGGIPDTLSDDKQILIYRCVQELLRNVVKHASAQLVDIRASSDGRALTVEVCDDGRGFDVAGWESRAEGDGFGLFSIRERIEQCGGGVEVRSAQGDGCTVALHLPIGEDEAKTEV